LIKGGGHRVFLREQQHSTEDDTMTANNKIDGISELINLLQQDNTDPLRELLQRFAELLMGAEANALCNAEYGQRDEQRTNQRNGYRRRRWDTRAGTIDLAVPKLRRGSYFPDWLLEPRRRSEKALWTAIATSYVLGVSTRRVDKLVKSLGLDGISKSQVSRMAGELDEQVEAFRQRPLATRCPYVWLDAVAIKVREDKRVVSIATVVAVGVREDGRREVLGVDAFTAEDGAAWQAFLRSLVARGLGGVKLVISDAHEGLRNAIAATFPGAGWQRCRTHFTRNLLTRVPKRAQSIVGTAIRTVFAQPTAEAVEQQYNKVLTNLEQSWPDAAKLLDDAKEDVLAFRHFPKKHWRQIWSNNPLERLNKEIRRRTNVVGIFPNRAALLRLVGAMLAELDDEWQESRRYMSLESMQHILDTPPVIEDDQTGNQLAFEQAA
jgi:transposase-like protein